jgi:hypothetical protein
MFYSYIYLQDKRNNVFKLGKTKSYNKHKFNKNEEIIYIVECKFCDLAKIKIINKFRVSYTNKRKIGTDYYSGNSDDMIEDIKKIVYEINNEKIDYITYKKNFTINETIKIDDYDIDDLTDIFNDETNFSLNNEKNYLNENESNETIKINDYDIDETNFSLNNEKNYLNESNNLTDNNYTDIFNDNANFSYLDYDLCNFLQQFN